MIINLLQNVNSHTHEEKMATKLQFDRDAPKIGNYALGNTLGHGTFGKVKGKNYHNIKPKYMKITNIGLYVK